MSQTTEQKKEIETPDANIGRDWNSKYGRQKIARRIEGCDDLYEVITNNDDKICRRYSVKSIELVIKNDEYSLTPEASAERARVVQRSNEVTAFMARLELDRQALEIRLTKFTDSAGYTPMKAGLAKKALEKLLIFKGKTMTTEAFVSDLVDAGRLPEIHQEDKIKPMTRMQSHRASNQQQQAHEQRIKDAGKKSVHYLVAANGYMEVGVFGYAYARYLIELR